jgi:hypothetical protein
MFVLLKPSSPSRRIFIGSHSLPLSLVRRIGPSQVSAIDLGTGNSSKTTMIGVGLDPK